MKVNWFASIIIFISSYSPLALILTIKDYNSDTNSFNNPIICIVLLLFGVLSILVLLIAMKDTNNGHRVKIEKISNRSNVLINYTIPYMISFFGFEISRITDLVSFLLFMMLLGVLTIKTQAIFINPILAIMNYNLFDVVYEENGKIKEGVFLTKLPLKIKKEYLIDKISNFTYLTTKEEK